MVPARIADLLSGPLGAGRLPISLVARGCDLRSRFIPKGQAGRGYRAIARNGRVLLASDVPVTELSGRILRFRLQVWHRIVLPQYGPEPYGLLLCVRGSDASPFFAARLIPAHLNHKFPLAVDVGGGSRLGFQHVTICG